VRGSAPIVFVVAGLLLMAADNRAVALVSVTSLIRLR
jgi:hypothetical protein